MDGFETGDNELITVTDEAPSETQDHSALQEHAALSEPQDHPAELEAPPVEQGGDGRLVELPVLTVAQPMADEIMFGAKWCENRIWATNYRGPLWIHAGATWDNYFEKTSAGSGQLGAILGRVELVDVVDMEQTDRASLRRLAQKHGLPTDRDAMWFVGEVFAWIFVRRAVLAEPIPCKGQLKIWRHRLSASRLQFMPTVNFDGQTWTPPADIESFALAAKAETASTAEPAPIDSMPAPANVQRRSTTKPAAKSKAVKQPADLAKLLMRAADLGDKDRVTELLDMGADVNATDRYGYNSLTRAALNGDAAVTKLLIKRGADVNHRPSDGGITALHTACLDGCLMVVKRLLAAGAKVNVKTDDGYSVLDYAQDVGRNRPEIIKLIKAAAADRTPELPVTDEPVSEKRRRPTASARPPGDGSAPSIDPIERDEVMAVIRDVFAAGTVLERGEAIKQISSALGYSRTGSRIAEALDRQLRAAVRCGILERNSGELRLACRSIGDYEPNFLVQQLLAGMGRAWIDRDSLIEQTARWLGFRRTGSVIVGTLKSVIATALRRGELESDGPRVRRVR